MSAPIEFFDSYASLLQRLLPCIAHALIARANGALRWVSDNQAEKTVNSTRAMRGGCAALPPAGIDGLEGEGSADSAMGRYSFCVCGALESLPQHRGRLRPLGVQCAID